MNPPTPNRYQTMFQQGSDAINQCGFSEAETVLLSLINEQPHHAPTMLLLGITTREQGKWAEAEDWLRKAITHKPDMAEAQSRLAEIELYKGEYLSGFKRYEHRWQAKTYESAARSLPKPLWDGSDIGEQTLFIHTEQGVGDAIMFMRYIPLVCERLPKAKILIAGDPHLADLFTYSYRDEPRIKVLKPESNVFIMKEPFDVHMPLLSLPRLFETTIDTIPQAMPYLDAPLDKHYKQGDEMVIGIAWHTKAQLSGPRRSMPLCSFERFANLPNIKLVDLQYGDTHAERSAFKGELLHDDSVDQLTDLCAFASQIKACDMVLSIDNTTVHLAGALGVPSWAMLPYAADWRWMVGESTPWYPFLRLFRQLKPGDWESVLNNVENELNGVLSSQ